MYGYSVYYYRIHHKNGETIPYQSINTYKSVMIIFLTLLILEPVISKADIAKWSEMRPAYVA